MVTIDIDRKAVQMEVDSGAAVATMPLRKFRELYFRLELNPNDVRLSPAGGNQLEPFGVAEVIVKYKGHQARLQLHIMENENFPTLMGRTWFTHLPVDLNELFPKIGVHHCSKQQGSPSASSPTDKALQERASKLLQKFANLTKPGIGRIPSSEVRLELTVEDPPSFYTRARPIAEAIVEMTDRELEFLEKNHVITKINASDWAHAAVVVQRAKGKKVRTCGDFKPGINNYIRVDEHPLKNMRQAIDNIGNGKRFSKLGIASAYLHLPVREEDRKYVVVNTHRGLYGFNRMSNGLSCVPAIWQRYIEGVLGGIPNVEVVMDDILVAGTADEDHLKHLEEVLSRLNEEDIQLNADKCEIFKESVTYCGFRIKHQGILKKDDKVQGIERAPSPRNVSELKALLGLVLCLVRSLTG